MLGIVATLAANMAQGWSHGPVGAVIAAWPAVSLVGSYELLVWIIRTAAAGEPARVPAADHGRQPWTGPWPVTAQPPDAGGGRDGQFTGLAAVNDDTPEPLARAARTDQQPGPRPDQADHPDQAADHPGMAADQVSGDLPLTGTGGGDDIPAAVTAYRSSVQQGAPLSERKLGGMFGKSRRWARSRMAEARQSPAPA